VISCRIGEPIRDVGSGFFGMLVGEQLQGVGGTHRLGEPRGRGKELVGRRQHELGLGNGLGGIVQSDR
jgi:hypothetical protein